MDKLKKVFSPGSSKDDEILYGDEHSRQTTGPAHPSNLATTTDTLEPNDPNEKKHEHGVLRQILNPGGQKYDQEGYGNTAHVAGSSSTGNTSQSHPAASAVPGTTLSNIKKEDGAAGSVSPASDLSIKSGVEGPFARANSEAIGSQGTTDDHHLGRDAAVLGGTGVAGGAAAHEANKHKDHHHHHDPTETSRTSVAPTTTTTTTNTNTTGSQNVDPAHQDGQHSHLGRDAAIGTGVAGGAAAYGAQHHKDHTRDQNQTTTGNTLHSGTSHAQATTSSALNSGNPSSTDTSRQSGTESHHLGRDAALGVAGGAAAYGASQHKDHTRGNDQSTTSNRDAAFGAAAQEAKHHNTNNKDDFGATTKTSSTGIGNTASTSHSAVSEHPHREAAIVGGTGLTGSGNTASSSHPTASDHPHREAAIVGGAGLTAGSAIAAHELGNRHNEPTRSEQSGLSQHPTTTISNTGSSGDHTSESIINRPHPLAGGTNVDGTATTTMFGGAGTEQRGVHQPGHTSSTSHEAATTGAGALTGGALGSQLNKPRDEPTNLGQGTGTEQRGIHQAGHTSGTSHDAARTGVGALVGGVAGSQLDRSHHDNNTTSQHTGIGSTDSSAQGWAPHNTRGPHQIDIANQLDPHVPGEFPSESGDDRHSHTGRNLAAGTAAGAGAGALASGLSGHGSSHTPGNATTSSSSHTGNQDHPITTTTNTHSHGQATGTSVGSGLSGLGSSQNRADTNPSTSSHHTGHTSLGTEHANTHENTQHYSARTLGVLGGPMTGATLGGHELGDSTSESVPSGHHSKHTESGSHHGREAGLAAGAGAAGVGAYEANKSHGETGPASKTIGPHSSNLANIADPRVQPEPSKMTGHTTSGPYQSDLANRVDPRVQSDPTKVEKDHHHGREAAGAGAGAAAVYGSESADKHDKHHNKLQKARKDEAEHGGDHAEKKPSLIHRILHPGEHKKESEHSTHAHGTATGSSSQATDSEGRVIEPHTGLPMNVEKYGSGAGGTDGSRNIEGYHETDPAARGIATGTTGIAGTTTGHHAGGESVAGPDWEAVRKNNT